MMWLQQELYRSIGRDINLRSLQQNSAGRRNTEYGRNITMLGIGWKSLSLLQALIGKQRLNVGGGDRN